MKRAVDKYFPRNGPCVFHRTRYARHRVVDAIRDRHKAGESIAFLAADCDLPRAAIQAAASSTPDDNRMTRGEMKRVSKPCDA